MLWSKIAEAMAPALQALRGALTVHIVLDAATHQALDGKSSDLGKQLALALAKHQVHLKLATDVHAELALCALDGWMDRPFATPLLLIAAQRATDPDAPAFSEAAMAMLLQAASARETKSVAGVRLYRPMPATSDSLVHDLAEVCRVQSPQASHAWLTAVDARLQGRLLACTSQAGAAPAWQAHNLDEAIGIPGPLSAWIALGMAARAAALTGSAQLSIAGGADETATLCMLCPHGRS
jgi:hypothetical protein